MKRQIVFLCLLFFANTKGLLAEDAESVAAIYELKSQIASLQTTMNSLQAEQNKAKSDSDNLRAEVDKLEKELKAKEGSVKEPNTPKPSSENKDTGANDRLKPWIEKTLALMREQVSVLSSDLEALRFKFQKIFDTPNEIVLEVGSTEAKKQAPDKEGFKIYSNSLQGRFQKNVQFYEDIELEISFFGGFKDPSEISKSDPLVNQKTRLSIHIPRHYQETGKPIQLTFGPPSFFAPTVFLVHREKNDPFRGRCTKCQITFTSIGPNRLIGQGQIYLQNLINKKPFQIELQKFSVGISD